MPSEMTLGGTQKVDNVRVPDDLFALHGLAVIHVHDNQGDTKVMTLPFIAGCDKHLSFTKGTLLYSYLITFGRQSVPLLYKLLRTKYEMSSEDINREVKSIATSLEVKARASFNSTKT